MKLYQKKGIESYLIPVTSDHLTLEDFRRFETVFSRLLETKTLLRCAANLRVTAFYSSYTIKHLGWSEAQADALSGNKYGV